MTYVWYACYGSNINRERFMRYINNCTDRTEPAEDRPYEFAHPVFFAGTSSIWEGKGKAFLDDTADGHAFGRIYKITDEQYREVKVYEGRDYTKKVELGMLEGIPVVTFTCRQKPEPERADPSAEYLEVILSGLRETYPDIRESALAADLIHGIFNDHEIRILDCMRRSEHGLKIRSIAEITGLELIRVNECITSLARMKVIRQDRRSLRYEETDDRAVFYTEENDRYVIDKIRGLIDAEEKMQEVPIDDPLITAVAVEGGRRVIQLPIRCAKLKSELINIELKNHTIGKQIDKLQAGLYTSVSVVEQTRIRKNMQASLSYSRDMKSGTGTDGKWR